MFMESRMRGDVHVRLYVHVAVMLKSRFGEPGFPC